MKTRNDYWLNQRLSFIWRRYFADVKMINKVSIHFSRRSKLRFGSIRLIKHNLFCKAESRILINGNFAKSLIPAAVVDYTIAHELVHYATGFSSNHPRLHRYPHHAGLVNKELLKRGLAKTVKAYQLWLDSYRRLLKADLAQK